VTDTLMSGNAVLVEAVRVHGEPRQRYVGCLWGIGQQELESSAARRRIFWDYVLDRLHDLGVAPEAHTRIVATLARKVPVPTRELYIASHRDSHEFLGSEFHHWPAHPLYDLSDLIREVEAAPAEPTLAERLASHLGGRPRHSEPPPDPTHAGPSPVRAHPGPSLARLPISIGRADGHLGIGYRGADRNAGRNRSVERAIEDDLTSENVRSWGKETSRC
jgi:hypothetical protein